MILLQFNLGKYLGSLWHGEELQILQHKCNLQKSGRPKSQVLPVFHTFSGCDTTSAIKGKGQKSIWQAWQADTEVTETSVYLASHPFQILDLENEHFQKLEKLTVVLYDKTSPLSCVNVLRRELFCQKNRAMDKLPPTRDALLQHVHHTFYKADIWTTSTEAQQMIPNL